MEPPAPPPAKCACGGRIEPTTNGNGGVVDRCSRCGAQEGEGRSPIGVAMGKPCRVDGCVGVIDASNRCPCCLRRATWAEAHIPKRRCAICDGIVTGRGTVKYCGACAPVAKRAAMAGWKARADRD